MRLEKFRGLLWVLLGVVLVLFYVSFVTARTYYNPWATLLIIILGAFISIGGLFSSRLQRTKGARFFMNPLLSRARTIFPTLFVLTLVALSADVLLTLYAVSSFGFQVEANKAVASLIRRGEILTWLGQQFAPAVITGIIFGLFKNIYLRTMTVFFTLGTLGYALATVLNDILVVYGLSTLRA